MYNKAEDSVRIKIDSNILSVTSSHHSYDPYEELAYAIIYQQLVDLDKGLKKARRTNLPEEEVSSVWMAKRFFCSDWFSELCSDTLCGPRILEEALKNFEKNQTVFRKEAKNEKRR